MDTEIYDTLVAIAEKHPDLCGHEGEVFTLRFPDGSPPLTIDTDVENGGQSHFALVVGWALQVLQHGLHPYLTADVEVETDDDDGMTVYQVSAPLLGLGIVGESEIFEYAVFDCLKGSLEERQKGTWEHSLRSVMRGSNAEDAA